MWYIGQKVVCIHTFCGFNRDGSRTSPTPPKKDKVCIVDEIEQENNTTYLLLEGFNDTPRKNLFLDRYFVPLEDWEGTESMDEAIKDALEQKDIISI